MSSKNIPPPPQYPNYSNADVIDSNLSKENSVMENSVIYMSDGGSPNYKTTRHNGHLHNIHQILPNLVNSINSTYQNLPPKSPKFTNRNMLNNADCSQKNNQNRKVEPTNEILSQGYIPNHNPVFNTQNQQYWIVRPRDELNGDSGFKVRQEHFNSVATKTRSHPNLMNDYVNLTGTESILNEILYNRSNKPFIPVANDSAKNYMFKPHQVNQEQFNTVIEQTPTSPEMFRNGYQIHPSQRFPEYTLNSDHVSTDSNRLINMLLEENKQLRVNIRQSDSKLEYVDQLERKIHNLELLFEELLTSQRRQRLLDLQLQQATLNNYIRKNDVSPTDPITTNTTPSTCCAPTSFSDNNSRPIDLRKTAVSSSQSIIPSSPIIAQKLVEDSPGERSLGFGIRKANGEVTKQIGTDQERYLIENECSENWTEQVPMSPVQDSAPNMNPAHLQKTFEDNLSQKVRQTIKSVNIVTSPYFARVTESLPSFINSPGDILGRKMFMSSAASAAARNPQLQDSPILPSNRFKLSQQPAALVTVNNYRTNSSPKATSVINLTSS